MEVTGIPFNKFIGLKDITDSEFILELPNSKKYLNHLGTIHASALFALAEASSGKFLLTSCKDISNNVFPVVRNVKIKFRNPASGRIKSKARIVGKNIQGIIDELNEKGRILIEVEVELFSENLEIVMIANFEWFVSLIKDLREEKNKENRL